MKMSRYNQQRRLFPLHQRSYHTTQSSVNAHAITEPVNNHKRVQSCVRSALRSRSSRQVRLHGDCYTSNWVWLIVLVMFFYGVGVMAQVGDRIDLTDLQGSWSVEEHQPRDPGMFGSGSSGSGGSTGSSGAASEASISSYSSVDSTNQNQLERRGVKVLYHGDAGFGHDSVSRHVVGNGGNSPSILFDNTNNYNLITRLQKRDGESNAPRDQGGQQGHGTVQHSSSSSSTSTSHHNSPSSSSSSALPVGALACDTNTDVTWDIQGPVWRRSSAVPDRFNSNGRYFVLQAVRGDDMNFVKFRVFADLITEVQPCVGYVRDHEKLRVIMNATDPTSCPDKFDEYAGVCNRFVFWTGTCKSGKCKSGATSSISSSSYGSGSAGSGSGSGTSGSSDSSSNSGGSASSDSGNGNGGSDTSGSKSLMKGVEIFGGNVGFVGYFVGLGIILIGWV
ncbi:hypothetical protein HDU76_004078 [Blyttiomyces sp. JEL0837]|nr:hypothetical protein HDU76_004078 [Blyttiomyces sp. JEL0837]